MQYSHTYPHKRDICALSITGSEQQHFALRTAIIYHMLSFPHLFVGNGADGLPSCISLYPHPRRYNSVEEYIV